MELFRLLGLIGVDNEDANDAIDETSTLAQQSEGKMSEAFSKIGSAAMEVGKVIAAGFATAATAIGALAANSLSRYADYEQLVGGVNTLFEASEQTVEELMEQNGWSYEMAERRLQGYNYAANTVLNNAAQAYKTAGMSANEYMETVTSFAAAMVQGVGGDTEIAANYADMAIQDMADNANKMGSSLETIQTAYQGFSKQNYTMLDNLKLGYGGTKEEMQRLLADAQELSGYEYDISNFADIADAINVIQTQMGITGTTAKEASQTISGSVASMKASWANLVTGFGDENANLTELMDQFVESALIAADNIIPRIEIILGRIAEGVAQFIPELANQLPGLLETMLPPLIDGAVALFSGLVSALPSIMQILIDQVPTIISKLASALVDAFPLLISTARTLIQQFLTYISRDVLGSSVDLGSVFSSLADSFGTAMDMILPMLADVAEAILPVILEVIEMLVPFIVQVVEEILPVLTELLGQLLPFIVQVAQDVLPIILNLIEQLLPVIMEIVQSVLPVFSQILAVLLPVLQNLIDLLVPIIQRFIELLMPILNLVAQAITPLMDSIMLLISSALEILEPILVALITLIADVMEPLMQALFPIFEGLIMAISPIMDMLTVLMNIILAPLVPIIQAVASVVGGVLSVAFTSLEPVIQAIMDIFTGLINFISGVFTGDWESAWNGIVDVFKGIINLIPAAFEAVLNAAIGLINGIIGGINDVTSVVGIPEIPNIPTVTIPKLEEGGVLEKGQVGLLEGNGAEAVVPLDQNRKWIARVSEEMRVQGMGSDSESAGILRDILEMLTEIRDAGESLTDDLVDSMAEGLRFSIDNREFARLVRAVD